MSLAPLDSESISMTKCSNDCRSPMWNMGAVKRICGNKSKTPLARVEHGVALRQ